MRLLSVPSSQGELGKNAGTEHGPKRVYELLPCFYKAESGKLPVFSLSEILVPENNLSTAHTVIERAVAKESSAIILGGDHSITYGAFRAFAKNNPGAGILIFDAHPDLMQSFQPPTHENFLRCLIEEGAVDPARVVLVGIRNSDIIEDAYIKEQNIRVFDMRKITLEGKDDMCDAIMSYVRQFPALYVSVDIDVVDAASVPGTGHPEPGGMTPRELIYFLQRIRWLSNVRMCDVVEVNPLKDLQDMTALLAAKLVVELS